MYVAVFLYSESRERMRGAVCGAGSGSSGWGGGGGRVGAPSALYDTIHADHVTIKPTPARADITRALVDAVGLPLHLVTSRVHSSARHGVQLATVGWPDFSPPPPPPPPAMMGALLLEAGAGGGGGGGGTRPPRRNTRGDSTLSEAGLL